MVQIVIVKFTEKNVFFSVLNCMVDVYSYCIFNLLKPLAGTFKLLILTGGVI